MDPNKPSLPKVFPQLLDAKMLLQLMSVVLALEFAALALGIAFFLILHGLIFGVLWFMPYWEPAFRIYTRIMNLPHIPFAGAPLPWWRVLLLGLRAIIVIGLLCLGTWIIITKGFLGQNIVYAVFKYSSRP